MAIHLTPEGKKYILENMLLPKKEHLVQVYQPKDSNSITPKARKLHFATLENACNTIDSIEGLKHIYNLFIGTQEGVLLAIITTEGVDACLLLELESSINWKTS